MNILVSAFAFVLFAAFYVPSILAAQSFTVIVAPQGRLEYDPPYVRLGAGDTVVFIFQDARHSVTQSASESDPCVKLPIGSDTGIRPSTLGRKEDHGFTLYPEYDGSPRWFFSATHCSDGMVFAINPPPGGLDAYRAAARNTGNNNTPAPAPPPPSQPTTPPPTTATITVSGGVTTVVTTGPSPNPQQPPSNPDNAASSAANIPPAASPSVPNGAPSGTTQLVANPSSSSSPSRPVAPGQAYEHIIGVGDDGLLTFSPVRIQALVGDIVTFEIRSSNHTVVQSTFDNPCQPLVKEDGNLGFRSGLLSAGNQTANEFPRFSVRVNDTAPIYAFDGQAQHCQSGMVFAVNVEAEQFAAFQRSAQLGPSSAQSEDGGALTLHAAAAWTSTMLVSIGVVLVAS